MEWKIGEIKQINGEWYQCVEGNGCDECSLNSCCVAVQNMFYCFPQDRDDKKSVIFKRLEKVGEPYADACLSGRVIYFQRYKIYDELYSHNTEYIMTPSNNFIIGIELKQNKENMKEKNDNIKTKPFNLEEAKAGKPVCTRDGRKARIICFDKKGGYPLVVLIEDDGGEWIENYEVDGLNDPNGKEDNLDLMMLPERKEGWVNIYKGDDRRVAIVSNAYSTKEKALSKIDEVLGATYITTNKIEWEE